jgi:hypothetical protein
MAESDIQAEPPEPPRRSERRRPRRDRDYDDEYDRRDEGPSGVETIIPYKNPMGLIAYYLGVFSFIPCVGLLLGPAALILGILGVRASKANSRAGGTGHAISGIVMGALTSLLNYGVVAFFFIASSQRW